MRLVRFKQLHEYGIVNDRMSLARKIEKEEFPKPLALGPNTLAWDLDEVHAWLASRPRRTPKTGAKKAAGSVIVAAG
jgi:predicted DNA-binding transcriptional regulator AlpA